MMQILKTFFTRTLRIFSKFLRIFQNLNLYRLIDFVTDKPIIPTDLTVIPTGLSVKIDVDCLKV
jgi:hypothetical protein